MKVCTGCRVSVYFLARLLFPRVMKTRSTKAILVSLLPDGVTIISGSLFTSCLITLVQ